MRIEFDNGKMELKAGEICVVPKGLAHKPCAREECRIMLVEPAVRINTGNAGAEMTAEENLWI